MASTHLTHLLKILSVAGIFISLVITAVFLVIAVIGALFGEEPATVWIIAWNGFFVALPLSGLLYMALKLREYLREILGALQRSPLNAAPGGRLDPALLGNK